MGSPFEGIFPLLRFVGFGGKRLCRCYKKRMKQQIDPNFDQALQSKTNFTNRGGYQGGQGRGLGRNRGRVVLYHIGTKLVRVVI